jgi:uncharacterized 2Fe-2S/4Fe-4S cluster protein (DUF4445 family)
LSKITIINDTEKRVIFADGEQNLLDILLENKIEIENPCNGKGTCYKCKIRVTSDKLIPLSSIEKEVLTKKEIANNIRLACFTKIDNSYSEVFIELLFNETNHKILSVGTIPDFKKDYHSYGYGISVDIGTTTVILTLVDLTNGKMVASSTRINPQKQYGLDVLTRITYEYENGDAGISRLQKAIVDALNDMITEVCLDTQISKDKILEIVIAANNTMLHMLLGVDARTIGKAPYQPLFLSAQRLNAEDIGLALTNASIYCLASVSGYVGADIVAGAYVSGLTAKNNKTLFIDIGTNGEIVLLNNNKLSCCSCAAGPALEGMNISSGMRAANGAIQDITIARDNITIDTIGNTKPIGLCGSGILASIKELLRVGIINGNGAFIRAKQLDDDDYRTKYIRLNGKKREFVIQEASDTTKEIIVSMNDVRQIQLAKGAILSGCIALLDNQNLEMKDLDEVIIAGQFGSHIAEDILINIGILSKDVANKISYIGNSSSSGAYMALMSNQARKDMEVLASQMNYIELAQTENYERLFTKCLIFPDEQIEDNMYE